MIEINLLPEEMRKKARKLKHAEAPALGLSSFDIKKLPYMNIAAVSVGALVALHIVLFSVGAYAKSRCASIARAYDKVSGQKKEYDQLKSQVDLINRKVRAIDDLMVKRFSWARKLNALSDSVTPGIWLSDLHYSEKDGERAVPKPSNKIASSALQKKQVPAKALPERVRMKYLVISGYASSMGEEGTALVGRFIKSLKDNPQFYSDFSDIELGSIKSERLQDHEVMSFRITCLFNPGE